MPLSPSAEWPLSSAEHMGEGTHALMTSACLVSSFSADSTWHRITALLQTSRSHDSPSEEMLALSGCAIMCVCVEAGLGQGGSWKFLAKVLGFLAILCF